MQQQVTNTKSSPQGKVKTPSKQETIKNYNGAPKSLTVSPDPHPQGKQESSPEVLPKEGQDQVAEANQEEFKVHQESIEDVKSTHQNQEEAKSQHSEADSSEKGSKTPSSEKKCVPGDRNFVNVNEYSSMRKQLSFCISRLRANEQITLGALGGKPGQDDCHGWDLERKDRMASPDQQFHNQKGPLMNRFTQTKKREIPKWKVGMLITLFKELSWWESSWLPEAQVSPKLWRYTLFFINI